jgi:hypothetical protein
VRHETVYAAANIDMTICSVCKNQPRDMQVLAKVLIAGRTCLTCSIREHRKPSDRPRCTPARMLASEPASVTHEGARTTAGGGDPPNVEPIHRQDATPATERGADTVSKAGVLEHDAPGIYGIGRLHRSVPQPQHQLRPLR